jgi:secreted trypsin-like serine protease
MIIDFKPFNFAFKSVLILMMTILLMASIGCSDSDSNEAETNQACDIVGLETRSLLSNKLNTKIINGVTCTDIDTSAIVRIAAFVETNEGTIPVPICTGSKFADNKIITAAHCVTLGDISGNTVSGYGIISGAVDDLKIIRASQVATPPGLRVVEGQYIQDVAILTFTESLPMKSLRLFTPDEAPSQVGETGYVYGYGKRNEGTTIGEGDDFFTLEAGAMTIESVNNNYVSVLFDGRGTNVCTGDSGGPLIVLRDNRPTIVGIVSQGTVEGCRAGDNTFFTNLQNQEIKKWIQGQ